MDPRSPNASPPRPDSRERRTAEFNLIADAFLELFHLLELHAPMWYTTRHHKRALTACRIVGLGRASDLDGRSHDR